MSEGERISFWHKLNERRVPQLVGLYLGGAWIVLEFTGFLAERYPISPNVIDLILLGVFAMLPSVIVLSYTHGRPGKDQVTRADMIVIPMNIVITIGLMVLLFQGKELGATTMTVTAEDETGATIERAITKASFRKRIALFYVENETGNADLDWITWWIPHGLYLDLAQDSYFDNRDPSHMSRALLESGSGGGAPPLALMRTLARRLHMTHFLSGKLISNAPLTVEMILYAASGAQVSSEQYTGAHINTLIDRISKDLKAALDVPTQRDGGEDLPLAAMSSDDAVALAAYSTGLNRYFFHSDLAGASRLLATATDLDSTFAQAQFFHYQVNLLLGLEAEQSIAMAMRYIYKVPERLQGAIKEVYYLWQGEPEKALAALRLDVTLFPDGIVARRRLARFYQRMALYAESLTEYQTIWAANPQNDLVLLDMAEVHAANGHFAEALQNLRNYSKGNPRHSRVLVEMGTVYQLLGEFDEAERLYERALLLGHSPAQVQVKQADLQFQQGRFGLALISARQAAEQAITAESKLAALAQLEQMYQQLGQVNNAMSTARVSMPLERKFTGPMSSVILRVKHFNVYAQTTQADSVRDMLESFRMDLPEPWNRALGVLGVVYKVAQRTQPISDAELRMVDEFYSEYKFLTDLPYELLRARIRENRGEYLEAIQDYIATLSHYPRRLMVQVEMARVYRLMDDYEAAAATLEPLLKVYPNHPQVLDEYYHIQLKTDVTAAQATMNRLMQIWLKADDTFLPAAEIRARLLRLLRS